MKRLVFVVACVAAASGFAASANEVVTYTYDHRGRLIKVVRTGTINNNVTTEYQYDKADNRTREKTTNSANPPPP